MHPAPATTIVGAGIAGLTTALAMARHGVSTRIYERASEFHEIGAGLQLSPNATRLLARLGVLDALEATAVCPQAVVLKKAKTLSPLAQIPLGAAAEMRWGAPYLVAHRADLQKALLERAQREPLIEIVAGALVESAAFDEGSGVRFRLVRDGRREDVRTRLLIAADGVWSHLRHHVRNAVRSRFTGYIAWRATLPLDEALAAGNGAIEADRVVAFMHPNFHLVAYPISGGASINLVAILPGTVPLTSWTQHADDTFLRNSLALTNPVLGRLAARAENCWTAWPIHEVPATGAWAHPEGMVLIGDAAHAVPPFAAQGAGMAIEDAVVLADLLACHRGAPETALAAYEAARKPRVNRVARRGAFNRFTWHASGPVALARDTILKARSREALMADFDWLYGFDAQIAPQN
ncbi:FAD-dependent monooxygenase [uncultured Nitratireductor sp.]|uniref:FAD-dependent monooxygenase n=1 Tax=uncultured Nitratireductor sp. TaxID=520953 RepID=UPI0025DA3C52|nr:FAD-dependent monooxygenase [uncultured Nitratireductor sp.]